MGEHDVNSLLDDASTRAQQHMILEDISALGHLLAEGQVESGVRCIGAEQEIFLIDAAGRPAPVAMEVLARANDPRLTTEIARFNIEANLTPRLFTGACLRELQVELEELLDKVKEAAAPLGASPLLCGILPTLVESDLKPENMTPNPRYHALSERLSHLRSEPFRIQLQGQDSLEFDHQGILAEGCNTSFQLHYQVDPERFALAYNFAQLLTGPLLAAAVNSPLLFGQRLWSETRIGLFQQAVDTRSVVLRKRAMPTRVSFGERWVERSVLEIFREDIERHRVILTRAEELAPSMQMLAEGKIPKLSALRLHNGTVYRWNRPCLGWNDECLHLRIEARAFPSGPSLTDELANAALFFGALHGALNELGDITTMLPFARVKEGFFAAARSGLEAKLPWIDGELHSAKTLLLKHILPMAYRGLHGAGINFHDAEYYLGIISERVHCGTTGASWTLSAWESLKSKDPDQKARSLVSQIRELQRRDIPVHAWPKEVPLASMGVMVSEIMSTDLFTVSSLDAIEIALAMLRWKNIRHLPVEDDQGHLVGMLTEGTLLRAVARKVSPTEPISLIMEPIRATLRPSDPLQVAMRLARERGVSALSVVADGCLIGLVTERDLLRAAERLLDYL
jgi:CBS domain-containing protein